MTMSKQLAMCAAGAAMISAFFVSYVPAVMIFLFSLACGALVALRLPTAPKALKVYRDEGLCDLNEIELPDSVGVVDPFWARKQGFVTLFEYFASLHVKEDFKAQWQQSALLALLNGLGLPAGLEGITGMFLSALPLGRYLPSSVPGLSTSDVALDPLAMATVAHIVGFPLNRAVRPTDALRRGEPQVGEATNVFGGNSLPPTVCLPDDLITAERASFLTMEDAVNADRRALSLDATPVAPVLLPGLCFGSGGLRRSETPREAFRNRFIAAVLNRLVANSLRSVNAADAPDEFVVLLPSAEGGTKRVTSAGEFLRVLGTYDGHLRGQFQTQIAYFSLALCLVEEPGAVPVPIPFALAMRTGLVDPENGKKIAVPATHSSFALSLRLPGSEFAVANVQYYMGTEGFTGFHPGGGWDAPWRAGATAHDDGFPLSIDEMARGADYGTALALAASVCAENNALPCGGYGSLGVCNDSLAIIQLCVRGKCTVGQTGGTGEGPQLLAITASKLAAAAEKNADDSLARDLRAVAKALVKVPCDPIVCPGTAAADAARRCLASLREAERDLPLSKLGLAFDALRRVERHWSGDVSP